MFLIIALFSIVILLLITWLLGLIDKSPHQVIRWCGAVIPPMVLLLYIFIPIDLFTIPLWILAYLLILWCVAKIMRFLLRYAFAKIKSKEFQIQSEIFKLVRPCVTILIISVAKYGVHASVVAANRAAIDLALGMNNFVKVNGNCSLDLDGWDLAENMGADTYRKYYGGFGTEYLIYYSCEPNRADFSYSVRIDQDSSYTVKSLPVGKLKATYRYKGEHFDLVLDESTNLDDLAKMKFGSKP